MTTDVSQVRTVTAKGLRRALDACVKINQPVFIWGPMGVGKSSVVEQMCEDYNGKMYDVRLSQVEQTDLRGIPFFNKDTSLMEWAPPIDLPSKKEAAKFERAFLFLDEMNAAAPAVQAAAYQLILNRRVGTYELPDNCVVVAAGNRESDKGVTYRQPAPLSNRFVHLELRVDFESWNEWALNKQLHPDVMGFLNFSKNSLFDFDPKSPSKAFATPRSWEFVSKVLQSDCDNTVASDIISGTIGEGLMLKLMGHRKHSANLPNAADIISGKVKELKTKEISAMYSLATSIAYELKSSLAEMKLAKKEKDWYGCADNAIKFMMDFFSTEITVMSVRAMLQQYNLPLSPSKMTTFKEFHSRFGTMIAKASSLG